MLADSQCKSSDLTPQTCWPIICWLFAAFALGQASYLAKGLYEPSAIAWVGIAAVCTLVSLFARRFGAQALVKQLLPVLIFLALFTQARQLLIAHQSESPERKFAWAQSIVIAVAIGTAAWSATRAKTLLRFGIIYCIAAMGLSVVVPWNPPEIDVLAFQKEGCRLLLDGQNPYAHQMPDVYSGSTRGWYGNRPVANGKVATGYCYPPLSLLMSLPGYLVGDVRYAQAVWLAVAVGIIAFLRSRISLIAAVLLALWPAYDFILRNSWTDLYAAPLIALVVYAAARRPRSWLLPVSLGLLFSVKQHLFLILPLTAMIVPDGFSWRRWWSLLWKSALVALAINVPFILPDPAGWYDSVIGFHLGTPFRFDSISFSNWIRLEWQFALPDAAGFGAFAAFCALALWLMPRTPACFAAAAGGAYLLFFAFGKQAFANYYYFVSAWMLCAVAAALPADAETPAGEVS